MGNILNLNLFLVGVASASMGVFGFVVFFNNKKSITNKSFLAFSLVTIFWNVVNYISYQASSPALILWLFRLVMLSATWQAFTFFQLMYVFPNSKAFFSKVYKIILLPAVIIVSIIVLSPLLFSGLVEVLPSNQVSQAKIGPGIIPFGIVSVGLVIAGFYLLIKKLRKAEKLEKRQYGFLLTGSILMFAMIVVFNFIFPAFLNIRTTMTLGALFILPFVFLMGYSVMKYKLLNIKIITTEIVAFALSVATLFELITTAELSTQIMRAGIFIAVLVFSILLIRSVRKEVEQREELQKLTEQLQKANTELEGLSKFKTQILSFASHQIKAPLATIKGFASILMEGLYGPVNDKIKETLGKMKNSSDELIGLINTLLDLRKVEEGKMDYKFETVNLKSLVQSVMDILKIQAEGKKLEFTFTSGYDGNVSADPEKFKQVIQNLIENSIKYTPQGFVKVATKEDGGYIIFSVSDSGLGIGPNLLPNLFSQEFVRDERVKHEIRGTGLGLFIAKRIVTDHGGEIWAKSDGEGKGSTFYVKLRKV